MTYDRFREQGEPHWSEFRELLRRHPRGVSSGNYDEIERFAALHRRVLSDFAYSRSHFGGTDAERRLRALAFEGHKALAARDEPFWPRLARYLARGFPLAFRQSRDALYAAIGTFACGTLLGFVVTLLEPDVASFFVGAENVELVRRGEVWVDSATRMAPAVVSSAILTNNITVALMAWAGGLTFGLLTLYVLLLNGAMLGCVIALTWQYGVLHKITTFISAHGPLELFLIIVAGAAGLVLARGMIGETSLPRRICLQRAGRSSIKLALGTVGPLLLLGIVEGFVSPEPSIAPGVKLLVGAVLLGLFLAWALRPVETGTGAPA